MSTCLAINTASTIQQQAEELYKKIGLGSDKKRQSFIDMADFSDPFSQKTSNISYSSDLKSVTANYTAR